MIRGNGVLRDTLRDEAPDLVTLKFREIIQEDGRDGVGRESFSRIIISDCHLSHESFFSPITTSYLENCRHT
jgi:hypothetical protein